MCSITQSTEVWLYFILVAAGGPRYDFSGYSDMAVGLSWMFGFECPENFNFPYMTKSVSEFWRRWHITLGSWFRDYIYIPLGGSRVKNKWRLYLNLFAVWMLTGMWHGADWTFVAWGLLYFLLIAFEKTTGLPERFSNKTLTEMYRVFTLMFINFMWVIFRADNLSEAMTFISHMFVGTENPIQDARALFLLKDNLVFVVAAVLLCMPVGAWIQKWMQSIAIGKNSGIKNGFKMTSDMYKTVCYILNVMFAVFNMFLFLWSISYVVAGANNPFVYVNF